MKTLSNKQKQGLEWALYWLNCYECPEDEECGENKLCKSCKEQVNAQKTIRDILQ